MAIGIIRKLDELGRIVPPKEMRDQLNIHAGDPVEIRLERDHIEIYPTGIAPEACSCCGKTERQMRKQAGVSLCGKCLQGFLEQEVKRLWD